MKTNNYLKEIRDKVKNINTDDEVEEIESMLDSISGVYILRQPRVDGQVKAIVERGVLVRAEVNQNISHSTTIGGGLTTYHDGPVEAHLTFEAHPDDIYDD